MTRAQSCALPPASRSLALPYLRHLQEDSLGMFILGRATRGANEVGAALHAAKYHRVEEILCFWMKRDIDRDHVAGRNHLGR